MNNMTADGCVGSERTEGAAPTIKNDDRKWTVMVFMGADTIAGNAPLHGAVQADLEEMAFVGSGESLNIFVQVHGQGVPRRYHIGVDKGQDVPDSQRNTAGGRALAHFIETSLMKVGHRRQDHSMLVLWGHAYDFAIGRAQTRSGAIDALDFAELSEVLRALQDKMLEKYGGGERPTLDVVGFDACDLSTVEMACQLQPFARYLLASQIGIPIPGWPYDRILYRLRHPIGRLMVPAEFGSWVVRRFCESYPASDPVSLTLLDLNRARELFAYAEFLALTLACAIGNPDARERIADSFSGSQTEERKPFVDVADLCLHLVRHSGDAFVIEAARALGDFLISPWPPLVGCSHTGKGRPFVVEHGRNSGHAARLNGISLYAPHVARDNDFDAARDLYHNFTFAQETCWSELVHTLARLGETGSQEAS